MKKVLALALFSLTLSPVALWSKAQSFVGEVSDAMCGAEHMMSGTKADCAHACAAKGSNYALVVGDKVYVLKSSNKEALNSFSQLAGHQAKVSGRLDGDTIEVTSITAAK